MSCDSIRSSVTFIVSFDLSSNEGLSVAQVIKRDGPTHYEVVNEFVGDDAEELYNKLSKRGENNGL